MQAPVHAWTMLTSQCDRPPPSPFFSSNQDVEVRDGETLADVAATAGLTLDQMVAANPGLPPTLPAGTVVCVPRMITAASKGNGR